MSVRIFTQTVAWDWKNRNVIGGGNPGFLDVPIHMRQDPGDPPQSMNSMELVFSCAPIYTAAGSHWAIQHLSSGSGFFRFDGGTFKPSIWLNEGVVPRSGEEEVHGSWRVGAQWEVEEPMGLVSTPVGSVPNTVSGLNGWRWIRLVVRKLPSGNAIDPAAWHIPCTGLIANVRINTGYLLPGVYMFNTAAVPFGDRVRQTYVRQIARWRESEIPVLHDMGYLVIHPPPEWKQIGFELDLGVIKSVHPDFPFDEIPVPIPEP